jgi:hypothetical protein
VLIKRTEREARRGNLALFAGQVDRGLDRRTFLRRSGLVAGGLGGAGCIAARQCASGPGRTAATRRRTGRDPQERLHALRGRLHSDGQDRQRCVDRSGAELGQPDQPRFALRQGVPRCASSSPESGGSNTP